MQSHKHVAAIKINSSYAFVALRGRVVLDWYVESAVFSVSQPRLKLVDSVRGDDIQRQIIPVTNLGPDHE